MIKNFPKPFLKNGGKMSGGYGSSSGYPFGSMLREQAVYQAKPFSKEEEALFAGTLKAATEADTRRTRYPFFL